MSIRVNVRMFKIMRTPIKLGVHTCATYTNCLHRERIFFSSIAHVYEGIQNEEGVMNVDINKLI